MLTFLKKIFGGTSPTAPSAESRKSSQEREGQHTREGTAYTLRDGKSIPVDAAFEAWTSGDLDAMLAAASTKTNKVDRHHLLQSIVEASYKRRKERRMRDLCVEYSQIHLSEFSAIAPVLKRQCNGVLPRVTTFQHYATVLTEDGDYDRAVELCRTAIKYGLEDGTASGFEGRITRILKQRPQ